MSRLWAKVSRAQEAAHLAVLMHGVGKTMNPHDGFGGFVSASVSESAREVVPLELIQKRVNQRMTNAKQRGVFPPHRELAVKSRGTVHAVNLRAA